MEEQEEEQVASDFFGQEINVGNFVVASQGHELAIYKVTKITPKMVRVVKHGAKTRSAKKGKLRYGKELFKVDESLVTFHLIQR